MFMYSQKICRFIAEIKASIRQIISEEVGLKVFHDRFYNRLKTISYPIRVVIYNNKEMLGYFDADFYELGFHEKLIHVKKEQLISIIKHEVAHYITFIEYGATQKPHSAEFIAICRRLGWNEEVYRAALSLQYENIGPEAAESAILRKVKKLMALAKSSNLHEAELAMVKSQQLLVEHQLSFDDALFDHDEKICLKRILKQKKENAKMRAIARILDTFFVSCVYSRGGEYTYLEISGRVVNVEIAEYVALFLQTELDILWKSVQQKERLQGLRAKNSFFLGLAKGYCDKIQSLKRSYTQDMTTALITMEKKRAEERAMIYPRLSRGTSSASYCCRSLQLGESMGQKLTINPAVSGSKAFSLYLGHLS